MSASTADLTPQELFVQSMAALAESDADVRALMPSKAIREAIQRPGLSLADIIAAVFAGYEDRSALGERSYEIGYDATGCRARQYLPAFSTVSYGALRRRIEALASAWQHHEHHRVGVDDFVCILGFTGIDFAVIDMATAYAQAVTVPLQTTLSGMDLERIFQDVAPSAVFATIGDLVQATRLAVENGTVRSVVAFDYDPRVDSEREQFEAARRQIECSQADIHLIALGELIEFGTKHVWHPPASHSRGAERVAGIIHSSGSTGTPKGVIVPERMMNLAWLGSQPVPMIAAVFAPMNHFLGRHQICTALARGGTAYCTAKPDLSTLFEDLRLIRPTFLFFFPRVLESIYRCYRNEVVRRTHEGNEDHDVVAASVRSDMRAHFLGGRLRAAAFGSAPTPHEIKTFMRECFEIMFIEGYGATESGIQTTVNDRVARPPVIDYRLRDVPELGYRTTDEPYPRGELLVKTTTQCLGYFKRPDETAALFDEEGYVITGDIMEERGPDHLVYIERRNDVLKLSQGEFVAAGRLATAFEGGSPVIHQMYVYGNSTRAYLLAVVVPDLEVVRAKIGHEPGDAELNALIRWEIQQVARSARLRKFEVPRQFIVELEPFSFENGLLSSVRKRMRPSLQRKYGARLEALYAEIERERQNDLASLRDSSSPLTVLEKVVRALEITLGLEAIDPDTGLSFFGLGGDSLAAVSFSSCLEDVFGVAPSVNAIFSPVGNPRRWADAIEKALDERDRAGRVLPRVRREIGLALDAKDLDIVNCLHSWGCDRVTSDMAPRQTHTVLMTGANGFLGRFLCLEWLERVALVGGKVICLIRANSVEDARRRLETAFTGTDGVLEQRYRALAGKHLEVLAGDIVEPTLGLTAGVWQRLASDVDHIVHPAALVNHVLDYEHLFVPNVHGTAQLIRLALTKRSKCFDFVSSMAVAYRMDDRGPVDEDSPLPQRLALHNQYAAGYAASKWAGEVQLHSAHRRFGMPVNIFRGDMMIAHSHYRAQINVPDMFTRLLYSVITTGMAPLSFYEHGRNGERARVHYDCLPVDFVAAVIAGVGAEAPHRLRTYHVINPHYDDGVSLDSVVDWVESAGYAVQREPEYARWLHRFRERLASLTEEKRKLSSFDLLHQFREPFAAQSRVFGHEHYLRALRRLPVGPEAPHLSEALVHKCLDDMRALGLISIPRAAS